MSLAFLISGFRALRYRSPLDGYYALYILGQDFTHFVNLGVWQQLGLSDSLPPRQLLVGAGMVMLQSDPRLPCPSARQGVGLTARQAAFGLRQGMPGKASA